MLVNRARHVRLLRRAEQVVERDAGEHRRRPLDERVHAGDGRLEPFVGKTRTKFENLVRYGSAIDKAPAAATYNPFSDLKARMEGKE